jgi:hypothetical protein
MLLLNFSHPLSSDQLAEIEVLTHQTIDQVLSFSVQFDNNQPFLPQLAGLAAQIPLSPNDWQTEAILVNPPSLNYITALLLAELHGRMGYFPPVLRLRPIADSLPPRYEVAEALNLQSVRDAARTARFDK